MANEIEWFNNPDFDEAQEKANPMRKPMRDGIGYHIFKHFKGKSYMVKDIAIDTETGKTIVIFAEVDEKGFTKFDSGVWCCPIEVFEAQVDKEKYPDAEQDMVFERLKFVSH